ncbi:hypothetical protein ACJX0J_035350 [Zea mays]
MAAGTLRSTVQHTNMDSTKTVIRDENGLVGIIIIQQEQSKSVSLRTMLHNWSIFGQVEPLQFLPFLPIFMFIVFLGVWERDVLVSWSIMASCLVLQNTKFIILSNIL